MWGKILTAVGYVKAPKATFMLRHPLAGGAAFLAYRAARKAAPRRRTRAVVAGAAAAAVAPLAVAALRRGS